MGSYVERYWVSDVSGMNKAERMGGTYRSYVPDMLASSVVSVGVTAVSKALTSTSLKARGSLLHKR